MKKLALAFLLLALFLPAAAFAKDQRVVQAEQWLQNLKTGQARFTQRSYDGTVLSGDFYIWRPGRLRFQYDPPVADFIVADGVLLHYYDSEQRQASTTPVGLTLADFLLRKNARLDGDLTVQNVRTKNGMVSMSVTQTADPASGQLTLNFTENPFALQSWSIIDPQGLTTHVTLVGLRTGVPVPPELFIYKDPAGRNRLND